MEVHKKAMDKTHKNNFENQSRKEDEAGWKTSDYFEIKPSYRRMEEERKHLGSIAVRKTSREIPWLHSGVSESTNQQ